MTILGTAVNETSGSIILQLDKEAMGFRAQPQTVVGKTFQPKDELHISLIGSSLAERLRDRGQLDAAITAADAVDYAYTLSDEQYRVASEKESGPAETIITPVQLTGLDPLYEQLERLLGEPLERPPAHITLYWIGDPNGIGIANGQEWAERVQERVEVAWQL